VAVELGQFYARIGVPTTMILRAPHVLSQIDDDIGDALTRYLREEGIRVITGAQVVRAERAGGRKRVIYKSSQGEETGVEADEIFQALGRIPDIEGLELANAGVKAHPNTGIEIDATMRTSNPRIFAVGDVTGRYLLVHVAIQQGELAARNAVKGKNEQID